MRKSIPRKVDVIIKIILVGLNGHEIGQTVVCTLIGKTVV